MDSTQLYKIFVEKGSLTKCQVVEDKFKRSMGKAIVKYEELSAAKEAQEEFDGHEIED